MYRVATVVQKIVADINGAVTEEENIMVIIKMFIKLMKPNGH